MGDYFEILLLYGMETKIIKRIWIVLVVLTTGCGIDAARFEVPQPEGERNLGHLPAKLVGTYRNMSDSSYMTILDDKVVLWSDATTNVHLSELDSVDRIQIKGDTPTCRRMVHGNNISL